MTTPNATLGGLDPQTTKGIDDYNRIMTAFLQTVAGVGVLGAMIYMGLTAERLRDVFNRILRGRAQPGDMELAGGAIDAAGPPAMDARDAAVVALREFDLGAAAGILASIPTNAKS